MRLRILRGHPRTLWAWLLVLGSGLLLLLPTVITLPIETFLDADEAFSQLVATDNAVAQSMSELDKAIAGASLPISSQTLTFSEISTMLEPTVEALESNWAARYLKYFEVSLRLHCVTTPFSEGKHIAHLDNYNVFQVPLAKCRGKLAALTERSSFLQPMLDRLDLLQQQLQISERHHRYSGTGKLLSNINVAQGHAANYHQLANNAVNLTIIFQKAASLLRIAVRDDSSHSPDPGLFKAVHKTLTRVKPIARSFLKTFKSVSTVLVYCPRLEVTNLFAFNVPLDIAPFTILPKIQELAKSFYARLEMRQPSFVKWIEGLSFLLPLLPHRISDFVFSSLSEKFTGDIPEISQEAKRIEVQDWNQELERRRGILDHLNKGLVKCDDPCIRQLYNWYTGERAAYLSGIVTGAAEAQEAAMKVSLAIFSKAEIAAPALKELSEGKVPLCYPSRARMYILMRLEEIDRFPQFEAQRKQSIPLLDNEIAQVLSENAVELLEKVFFVGNFYDSFQDLGSHYEKIYTAVMMTLGTLVSQANLGALGGRSFTLGELLLASEPLQRHLTIVSWRIRQEKPAQL